MNPCREEYDKGYNAGLRAIERQDKLDLINYKRALSYIADYEPTLVMQATEKFGL